MLSSTDLSAAICGRKSGSLNAYKYVVMSELLHYALQAIYEYVNCNET
jgi:hypothetical protein